MEYQQLKKHLEQLEFIPDRETADAAAKTVLGILASRLDDTGAHVLAGNLPGEFGFPRLRGRQEPEGRQMSVEEAIGVIATQHHLSQEQAEQLFHEVLRLAVQPIPEGSLNSLKSHLPEEWAAAIESS